ncbi:hypothetical protein SUGI_0530620 [Cryptomeria japonica]|nr:hypothetical protein SUGI_0530620 [Cryptomeria japonica]
MILRWGIIAYPFSASREEAELRKSELEEFNFRSQSSLEFIFRNLELFQSRAKEVRLRGDIKFVCVGPINKMLEFLPELKCALEKLGKVVQVFYVGEGVQNPGHKTVAFQEEEKEYEILRKKMCSITSLSLWNVYRFWERVKCLRDELGRQVIDERTMQVRSMVLAFFSACEWREKPWMQRENGEEVDEKGKGISIIAVDENGEMINGREEEIVQLLCQGTEEEERHKFMGEIKGDFFHLILKNNQVFKAIIKFKKEGKIRRLFFSNIEI